MNIEIRSAKIDDLPEIYEHEFDYIKEIEPENQSLWMKSIPNHLKQWIRLLNSTFVVSNKSGIVGHYYWDSEKENAQLCSIFVKQTHRRKGLAKQMLLHFENEAYSSGFKQLKLGVIVGNPAELLYKSFGYHFERNTDGYNYYQKRLDVV